VCSCPRNWEDDVEKNKSLEAAAMEITLKNSHGFNQAFKRFQNSQCFAVSICFYLR
jgi:hypothetical protein